MGEHNTNKTSGESTKERNKRYHIRESRVYSKEMENAFKNSFKKTYPWTEGLQLYHFIKSNLL